MLPVHCSQPVVNPPELCKDNTNTEVSWKERRKTKQMMLIIEFRYHTSTVVYTSSLCFCHFFTFKISWSTKWRYLLPNLSSEATRDTKDHYSDLCWLTILCAGLQLAGPVYIPVRMCVGVHERYIRVPHLAPSCRHRTLGGRLRLTSSFTSPPEIHLLAVVVGPASAFTTSHSHLTPALPSHPAEITHTVFTRRSRASCLDSSWLSVLSLGG